ncbi:alpha/beta hydrolase [Shinella kummerowiae]|uniref:alpha/beta hydrolase n=1 Tax=Shinella kummerowiae TaxID=417745 RepID=UPI0021B6CFA3|nr:alpha/beta hydrolase [Shinella kummerowiae]MCT7663850.1 alpha/beta hydrolase [Shinella kummerowiae]
MMRLMDCTLKTFTKTRLFRLAFLVFLLPCLLLPPACSYSTDTVGKHLAAGDTSKAHLEQNTSFDILYVTNRAPSTSAEEKLSYGATRGHSMAYGSVTLAHRGLSVEVVRISKHGEFPQSPYPIELTHRGPRRVPAVVDAHLRATAALQGEVSERLAKAKRKEVVVFIHGYNNSFDDAAKATGKICNTLSADFVCVSLSWPAGGSGGAFYGYNIDRESGEFAVLDLKKAIRTLATADGVERLHLIAHSRGADVLLSALHQLGMESYMTRTSISERYKINNVVLFAPDVDLDVATTKLFGFVSDPDAPFGTRASPYGLLPPVGSLHLTVYSSPNDQALALSSALFGSVIRLGRLTSASIDSKAASANALWNNTQISGVADFVEYQGNASFTGHSYFLDDPAVQRDLDALLRGHLKAGDPGRPLIEIKRPFWKIIGRTRQAKRD